MSRSRGKSEVICVDVGSTVAAKAGADAPGGGISLCFCRRGCAAPAKKAATLNVPPRSTPCRYGHCRRNRSPLRQRRIESDADLVAATALQAKPFSSAATKIRIGRGPRCRYGPAGETVLPCGSEDAASIRKSGPEIKNRCTQEGVNRQNLASILKSGLEIKNRCTPEGVNRQNHASIPKSGLEIKNRCTQEGVNRQNLASIRKSGLEIKNRCMQQAIFSTRSLNESLWR